MIGLAASPTTEVLPKCSIRIFVPSRISRKRARSLKRFGPQWIIFGDGDVHTQLLSGSRLSWSSWRQASAGKQNTHIRKVYSQRIRRIVRIHTEQSRENPPHPLNPLGISLSQGS